MLVKIQLPIDAERASSTGLGYVDRQNQTVRIYARDHLHDCIVLDDVLRQFMLNAEGGVGYLKAFMFAEWLGNHWVIDYAAGFQPMETW